MRAATLKRSGMVGAAVGLLLGAQLAISPAARAAEAMTYLFPAPPSLPAFGPIRLAKGKGYFTEAGIDVNFAVGRGGVECAGMRARLHCPLRQGHCRISATACGAVARVPSVPTSFAM